jgi:sensor histidine kinase YesM
MIQGSTSPIFLQIPFTYRLIIIGHFLFYIMIITGIYRVIYQKFEFWKKSLLFVSIQAVVAALVMVSLDVYCRYYVFYYVENVIIFVFNTVPIDQFMKNDPNPNIYYQAELLSKKNDMLRQYHAMNTLNLQITKFLAYVIWTFAFNAYRYSSNLIEARVEKFRYEGQLKEAELVNLRAQLNPHFLFNSLNSIHAMTMMKREEASDAVLLLSDLMRYTLNYENRNEVTVEEEMETVEKYLKLEKIRFGNKLNYSFDIQPDTLNMKIPLIMVQTLAENAIKHAIGQNKEGGHVVIKSFLEKGNLVIEVINSGRLETAPSVSSVKKTGIGIENTRRRLSMLYGEKAFFNLANWGNSEVKAMMQIPI